ncbi:MAG: hypothetical protein K0R87_2013 [Pseudonocardia sp.]|nr:hypothetical protein [Pseudonocardia sp.]
MHLPAASRPTRVRRLLAVSAAAAFVMIGPTACDYGTYSGGSSDGYAAGGQAESSSGGNVVPVGNSSPSTEESRRDRWQNAYVSNGGGDDGDGDGDNEQATTEPAAAETTDPAATPDPAAQVGNPASEDPAATGTAAPTESASATSTAAPVDANGRAVVGAGGQNRDNNGQNVLGRDCAGGTNADLDLHTGFQEAKAQCVETAMGAVADENNLPSLLITNAPKEVAVGQAFELQVSTRNLVRDRFLGAAAGGYYLEASFLDGKGLQRGHFHTACRILPKTSEAPDSKGAPEFFVATQDNGGGTAPDVVTIQVPGIKKDGELQCTSWAGDGSHRTPMMSRANQTPAIDSVRITVGGNGEAAAPAENGNAAGGAAQSQVPQPPAEGAQGQEDAGATAENNGAENEGGNNGAGESAEATSAETSEAEVAAVANNETAEAAASTAGAGTNN